MTRLRHSGKVGCAAMMNPTNTAPLNSQCVPVCCYVRSLRKKLYTTQTNWSTWKQGNYMVCFGSIYI